MADTEQKEWQAALDRLYAEDPFLAELDNLWGRALRDEITPDEYLRQAQKLRVKYGRLPTQRPTPRGAWCGERGDE